MTGSALERSSVLSERESLGVPIEQRLRRPITPYWMWFIVVLSCQSPYSGLPVSKEETLLLDTDWRFIRAWSGVFQDPENGEEFIFTGDPHTTKMVRVFDIHGHSLYDVPLGHALEVLGSIGGITFVSRDRLIVLEEHGQGYVVLDPVGEIVQYRSLHAELCTTGNDRYSLCVDGNGLGMFKGKVLTGASWYGACDEPDDAPFNQFDYFAVETRKCKMAKIDLHAMNPGVSFGACDVLPHLNDGVYNATGATGAIVINDRIFGVSLYSPDIMELDTQSLQVLRRIPIHYVKGSVGIRPPHASVEDEASDGANVRIATKAHIYSLSYDVPSARYLVTVPHAMEEEALEEQQRFARNWSLIVLDSSFAQEAEYVVPGAEYCVGTMLNLSNGTWVLRSAHGIKGVTAPKVFQRLLLP